jgi:hypothetical protein
MVASIIKILCMRLSFDDLRVQTLGAISRMGMGLPRRKPKERGGQE